MDKIKYFSVRYDSWHVHGGNYSSVEKAISILSKSSLLKDQLRNEFNQYLISEKPNKTKNIELIGILNKFREENGYEVNEMEFDTEDKNCSLTITHEANCLICEITKTVRIFSIVRNLEVKKEGQPYVPESSERKLIFEGPLTGKYYLSIYPEELELDTDYARL